MNNTAKRKTNVKRTDNEKAFNIALTKYIVQFGPQKYEEMFEVLNLSEVGQSTYQHSFDNAVEYYKLSAAQKSEQTALLSDFDED